MHIPPTYSNPATLTDILYDIWTGLIFKIVGFLWYHSHSFLDIPNLDYQKKPSIVELSWKQKTSSFSRTPPGCDYVTELIICLNSVSWHNPHEIYSATVRLICVAFICKSKLINIDEKLNGQIYDWMGLSLFREIFLIDSPYFAFW